MIFSSASPISIKDLRNYFSDDNITTKFIEQSIEEIHEKYIDSGVVLKKYQLATDFKFEKNIMNGYQIFIQTNHRSIQEL